uniref:KH_dom_type_1 domain-containing protein n=1 Tax=Heterorhabditis bacteriophora TaxID=37862 RepID=A0A1I7X2Z5_HETBA
MAKSDVLRNSNLEMNDDRTGDEDEETCAVNLCKEFVWIQSTRAQKTFQSALTCLRECCIRLHLGHKCDSRLGVPLSQPLSERQFLIGKHGGDNLKATVTLLGDNVIQAEVVIKHAKTAGGVFRAVAQPDIQWKLQQLQDLGNHISRATVALCDLERHMKDLGANGQFGLESGELILCSARSIKEEITAARSAILLPRKRYVHHTRWYHDKVHLKVYLFQWLNASCHT